MFKDLFGIVEDVAKIAVAPVKIAASITRTVTKPIADAVEYVADEVKDLTDIDKWQLNNHYQKGKPND